MEGFLFSDYIQSSELPRVIENHFNRLARKEKAEAVYTTIVLDKDKQSMPIKLQVAKINDIDTAVIPGLLEKI